MAPVATSMKHQNDDAADGTNAKKLKHSAAPLPSDLQHIGTNSAHSLPVANQTISSENDTLPHRHYTTLDAYKSKLANPEDTASSFEKELVKMEEIKGLTKSGHHQVWTRPSLSKSFDPQTTDIVFQQLDAEESILDNNSAIRFFGVTEEGNTVFCYVYGFLHYFYVPVPKGLSEKDLPDLTRMLKQNYPGVHNVEIAFKESIWGFNNNVKLPFLKVVMENAKTISKVRSAFERGEVQFNGLFPIDGSTTFDNIQYLLRMMIDCKITGMSWMTLPAGKYSVVKSENKVSSCQLEVSIHYKDLDSHPLEGEYSKIAPLRILSFDIECAGRKGIFPEAEKDPVIQIANVVSRTGESKPFVRNVFTVKSCSPIVGSEVHSYETELEMLMLWKEFVVTVDPDVIIGYNTANFDLPYLINRALALKLANFPYFGKMTNVKQEIKDTVFSSKAYGTRENKVINIEGRMQLDLLQIIQRDYKLRSYTLNSVSSHFLGEQKEDVHHSSITALQNGDADTRRRLAVYCLKDAYLPLRLLDKLMCLVNYTEMARVTGVPFSFLITRGQQIKVISQLFRKCLDLDIVIPNMKNEGTNEEYEGATVIDPVRGYYDVPIATLDFASLYPSIMMAHNLCYTTLLNRQTIERLGLVEGKDYTLTPNNDYFVKPELKKGILPTILQELLTARKNLKNDLKKETDPFKKQVLNGRQLALKISANSVYGFTGATIGKLPCLAISSSVTAFGRIMIEKTKQTVQEKYTKANGYDYDAKVIYGDTDSVMVKFGYQDLEKCMRLGEEAALFVSTKFKLPIKLEFEKVYFPYLLINKKRYAGLFWTNTEKADKMDTKGIETVRRDNCRLVQNVITRVLELILYDRDVQAAVEYVKQTIADLLQNKIDLSLLVITKLLSRYDYAGKQAHVELAERMKKRDAGSAPSIGDRVAYVIIKTASDKNYEKSEDPLYVLEHSLPIDSKYYLENQLSKPLMRIFEPILGEKKAKELLTGSHTRTVLMAAPKTGGLMRFAKKTELCKNCKSPLPRDDQLLCDNCVSKGIGAELYSEDLLKLSALESKFAKLWTECQRCQGSLHQEVLCSNNDCPIFYMRTKLGKDLNQQSLEILKWDATQW